MDSAAMRQEDQPDIDQLWERYRVSRAVADRNRLVELHLPLVSRVVGRVFGKLPKSSSVDRDDLKSNGCIGLIQAVERFDSRRKLSFTTFATHRIRGAIQDGLRELDFLSRNERKRLAATDEPEPQFQPIQEWQHPRTRDTSSLRAEWWDDMLRALAPKARKVVAMYYRDGLRMKEIAARLSLTERRVSQIIATAVVQLRAARNPQHTSTL